MTTSRPSDQLSVSVILPTYRSAAFVGRAIDSVLGQEGHYIRELIVIDDCSPDDTVEVIRSRYGADQRVTLLSTEHNGGPGVARNVGLAAATGDCIALVDADDAWVPDRLSRLIKLFTADVDLLFDNLILFDHATGRVNGTMFEFLPEKINIAAMTEERIAGSAFNYGYLKPLISRSFLLRTGVMYPNVRVNEDLLFYLELLIRRARARTTNVGGYVYTTPISVSSGRRSNLSTSKSDDLHVAIRLEELLSKHRGRLTQQEVQAIHRRVEALRVSAPLTRLYDNWMQGRYIPFLEEILTDSSARRALIRKLLKKLL